jgi:hypothetical protein
MARRVCSRADEALRDEYKLARWVNKVVERRDLYFAFCARATKELARFSRGAAPKEESIVLMLIAALAEDDSFAGHVRHRGGTFLADDDNWERLRRAGAATILEEYLDATENGR